MIVDHIDALERALALRGFPATSPWWRAQIERFYRSGRRQFVLRCGRRGGKSTTLCRIAVLEALWGDHKIQPGDVGIVGIVSVSRDEAASRLRTIKALLNALGAKYTEKGDTLILEGRPVIFKVFTASIAGVVGGTWICAIADEVSRWADADTGASPAKEVLASLRPTLATMPSAKLFLSSSPLGSEDAHAVAFDAGENSFQLVAHAESWIANPSITEAETHELEPDERAWRREFAAIPSTVANGAFDSEHIASACTRLLPGGNVEMAAPAVVIDWASGKNDELVWAVCRWVLPASSLYKRAQKYLGGGTYVWEDVTDKNGERIELTTAEIFKPRLHVGEIKGIAGNFGKKISAEEIVNRISNDADRVGAINIVGDQREDFALVSMFNRRRIRFVPIAWTAPGKQKAVENLRRLLREDQISFAADPILKTQLLQYEERITSSGNFIYSGRGNRRDDRAALCLTLSMAELAGLLPSSPCAPRYVYRDYTNLPIP